MGTTDPAEAEDADLVLAMARDPAALEEFYRRHVRPLTRYAARRVGETQAPDIVAAAFLAAIESVGGYDRSRGEPAAWLYGIAGNLIGTHLRRLAAENRAMVRLSGQRAVGSDEYGRLEESLDASRHTAACGITLAALPNAERELLDLVLHRDLTVVEAARTLGIRPGTARMRLSRARTRLLAQLRRTGGAGNG